MYAMMPLKKNIPRGHKDWIPATCPICGQECWERKEHNETIKALGATLVCTECALRKGAKDGENNRRNSR